MARMTSSRCLGETADRIVSVSIRTASRSNVLDLERILTAILILTAHRACTAERLSIGHLGLYALIKGAFMKNASLTTNAKTTCTAGTHLQLIVQQTRRNVSNYGASQTVRYLDGSKSALVTVHR